MGLSLTDAQIETLLAERKRLPDDWQARVVLKPKRGHKEREFDWSGDAGSRFSLILRLADLNPLDFSAILGFVAPQTSQVFRLLRCNGKSHEHTNRIEMATFYDFHVHRATERYQHEGFPEDGFAEVTDKYCDFVGALDTLLLLGGIERPKSPQGELFDLGGQP